MFIKVIGADVANKKLHTYTFLISILFLFFSLAHLFFSELDVTIRLASLVFIVIFSSVQLLPGYINSPFSLILNIWTILFFLLPLNHLLFHGLDHILFLTRQDGAYYLDGFLNSIGLALSFFTLCWLALALGISGKSYSGKKLNTDLNLSRVSLRGLTLAAIFIIPYLLFNMYEGRQALLSQSGYEETLIKFIFFDSSFILLAALILNERLSVVNNNCVRQLRFMTGVLFLSFLAGFTFLAKSKSGILIVWLLTVVYVISLQKSYRGGEVMVPSKFSFSLLGFLAPALYLVADLSRQTFSDSAFFYSLTIIEKATETLSSIFYRLFYGGLEQYLSIFYEFILKEYDPSFVSYFLSYLSKNFVNLIAPGTIYQEAYAPSSQIFYDVLLREIPDTNSSSVELLLNLNTQPYTLFGLFIIPFFIFAPVFLYCFGRFLILLFNFFSGRLPRITLIFFFGSVLNCYGIETNIANALHLTVSIILIYWVMRMLSVSLRPAKKLGSPQKVGK